MNKFKYILPVFYLLLLFIPANAENIIIVIIDGARYSETLGDTSRTYTPEMWKLADQGTHLTHFYNDSMTYTARAIPALWCGTWTDVRDTFYAGSNTKYAVKPTIFEYIRKQKNLPPDQFYYFIKYLPSLWLPSFDPDYGPDYWPTYHSIGTTDSEVMAEAVSVMGTYHPQYLLIYLADVDSKGHSGNWENYTAAIHTADMLVGHLWDVVQEDTFYAGKTTMFVTNDHGRHDEDHGGFSGHGDGCDGCRHIQYLAIGPNIKRNFSSERYRRIPDMAVTVAAIAGVEPSKASGEVMDEIFLTTKITNKEIIGGDLLSMDNYPNPFNMRTTIRYRLNARSKVMLDIYNIVGQKIVNIVNATQSAGLNIVTWEGCNLNGEAVGSGVYFAVLRIDDQLITHKILLVR
jgi:hypothetical protein